MEFSEIGDPTDIKEAILVQIVKNTGQSRKLKSTHVDGLIKCSEMNINENSSRVVDLEKMTGSWKLFQDFVFGRVNACRAAMMAGIKIESLCIDERRLRSLSMATKTWNDPQ